MIKWHPVIPHGWLVAHTAVCGMYSIQLFEERLSEEMHMQQSQKVIWDMINTLFVTTEAVKPTFAAFL